MSNTPTIDRENTLPVQVVFTDLHEESVNHKLHGEHYDPHLELIEGSLLGRTEEELWDKYQYAKTKEDFDALQKDASNYRDNLRDHWNMMKNSERDNKATFITYLINKMLVKRMKLLGIE